MKDHRRSPDELWRSILASPFGGAYLNELYRLSHLVVSLTEEVFRLAPKPASPDDYLKVDQEVMQRLFAVLSAAARVRSLISDRPIWGKQDASEYAVQKRRTAWIREDVLGSVRLEKLLDPSVRHSLEHFDEYIDRSAVDFAAGKTPVPAIAPIDFVVSRRSVLKRFKVDQKTPHLHFMRVFIASERVFVNCGHEISIQALHTECRRIVKRVLPLVPDSDAQGSSMMIITSGTFPGRRA